MIPAEKFRAASRDGLSIAQDHGLHSQLALHASRRLAGFRQWNRPDRPELADHLSDFLGCLRKAELRRRDRTRLVEQGLNPWDADETDGLVFFATGYAFQQGIFGAVEESVWEPELEFWYSPDAVLNEALFEAKTTRSSPLKKADTEAGLSIEDVLLRDRTDWWRYMLSVMHLTGRREYALSLFWVVPGEWATFRVRATEERVAANWLEVDGRVGLLRAHRQAKSLPALATRTRPGECDLCQYRFRDPCMAELLKVGGV